jgi:hypothetical protein
MDFIRCSLLKETVRTIRKNEDGCSQSNDNSVRDSKLIGQLGCGRRDHRRGYRANEGECGYNGGCRPFSFECPTDNGK